MTSVLVDLSSSTSLTVSWNWYLPTFISPDAVAIDLSASVIDRIVGPLKYQDNNIENTK